MRVWWSIFTGIWRFTPWLCQKMSSRFSATILLAARTWRSRTTISIFPARKTCVSFTDLINVSSPGFHSKFLERSSRRTVYHMVLGVFIGILGPFAFFDVSKTKLLQLVTSLVRWISFLSMIILGKERIQTLNFKAYSYYLFLQQLCASLMEILWLQSSRTFLLFRIYSAWQFTHSCASTRFLLFWRRFRESPNWRKCSRGISYLFFLFICFFASPLRSALTIKLSR